MRILVLSDIHGSNTGLMTTIELCQRYEPDLVVICGDITQFGPHEWAKRYLGRIPIQAAAIPGNCDPEDLDQTVEQSNAINLHRKSMEISGLPFIGAGGADYTPFNTIFEFGDDTFAGWLDPIMTENAVLVTHAPAQGILDEDHLGNHRGSRSLRKIVDKWKPILMLSGHMHDARGVMVHKGTVCVNPGPAKDGFGALVELSTPWELEDVEKGIQKQKGQKDGEKEQEDSGDGEQKQEGTTGLNSSEMWKKVRASVEARLVSA